MFHFPLQTLATRASISTSVCVGSRQNTHHVKNDSVVSACYLHGDGRLVVRYGADVLPSVAQTETQTGFYFPRR